MNGKPIINAYLQSETEVMAGIFNGSLHSRTSTPPWHKWAGHAVAETLTLGIWSLQYSLDSPCRNDFKDSGKVLGREHDAA